MVLGNNPPEPLTLAALDISAWAELESAAGHPDSGFRYLNLCSVDAANRPQARMVVLRRTDVPARILEFHTDVRSRKWLELSANPLATVLGFCAHTRLQLRLQGKIELHEPGTPVAELAWNRLPPWTRKTYAGGPPGDEFAFESIGETAPPSNGANETDGKAHFGVIIFRAASLDWFQLRRQGNRRGRFDYDDTGSLNQCQWVNP